MAGNFLTFQLQLVVDERSILALLDLEHGSGIYLQDTEPKIKIDLKSVQLHFVEVFNLLLPLKKMASICNAILDFPFHLVARLEGDEALPAQILSQGVRVSLKLVAKEI